jgi:glycosyltransferase involved in cell wall biosynthesis
MNYGLDKTLHFYYYPHYDIDKLTNIIPDCDINIATFCYTAFSVFRSGKGIHFYHMQHYEPLFFNDPYLQKIAGETYSLPLNKIANSLWLQQQIKERYGITPPIVNPTIDHSLFYPREVEREGNSLKVLCFAKETRWKVFPEALQAMEMVMKQRNDVEFLAYGMSKPSYPANIPYRFIQAPSDDELAHLYSSVDVVICP